MHILEDTGEHFKNVGTKETFYKGSFLKGTAR